MGVGEEQGVEARYASSQGLEAELGTRVDDHRREKARGVAPLDEDRGSVPAIPRIGGLADMAIAAYFRHSEARARSEKKYAHDRPVSPAPAILFKGYGIRTIPGDMPFSD